MIGSTSTVPHTSKWQAPDWRKESKMKPRLHSSKKIPDSWHKLAKKDMNKCDTVCCMRMLS